MNAVQGAKESESCVAASPVCVILIIWKSSDTQSLPRNSLQNLSKSNFILIKLSKINQINKSLPSE